MKSTQGTALSRAKRCTAASKASVILASGAVEAIGNLTKASVSKATHAVM